MTISTTARTEQPMVSPAALSVPGETGVPARRRLDLLADRGSLVELGSGARHRVSAFNMQSRRPAGDGVVTALARVDQRPVALFAQDSTVLGGSLGETHAAKIVRIMEWAGRSRMTTTCRSSPAPTICQALVRHQSAARRTLRAARVHEGG